MSHINYKFLLGNIIFKPNAVNVKYSDELIDAFPISSTFDLSSDGKYDEFLSIYTVSSSFTKRTVIREIMFPLPNNVYENKKDLLNSTLNTISVENAIGLDIGVDSEPPHAWNTATWSGANPFSGAFYFNFLLSDGGHTHKYIPIVLTDSISVQGSDNPTSTKVVIDGGYILSRSTSTFVPTSENDLNEVSLFYTVRGTTYTSDPLKKIPVYNENNVVNNGDDYISIINRSAFINKDTGAEFSDYIYDNSKSKYLKDNAIYETAFFPATLGTNMLLVTAVNRNIFEPEDIEYLKSLVGTIFFGILPPSHYINCPSLEIVPVNMIPSNLEESQYPDFFKYYNKVGAGSFDFNTLLKSNTNINNRTLLQTTDINDLNEGSLPNLDEEVVSKLDYYLQHSVKMLNFMPPTVKVKAGGSTQPVYSVRNFNATSPDKQTEKTYTNPRGSEYGVLDGTSNNSPIGLGGVNAPIKSLALPAYIILRYKL